MDASSYSHYPRGERGKREETPRPRRTAQLGIGILVEVARRLGMAFIAARAKVAAEKQAEAGT